MHYQLTTSFIAISPLDSTEMLLLKCTNDLLKIKPTTSFQAIILLIYIQFLILLIADFLTKLLSSIEFWSIIVLWPVSSRFSHLLEKGSPLSCLLSSPFCPSPGAPTPICILSLSSPHSLSKLSFADVKLDHLLFLRHALTLQTSLPCSLCFPLPFYSICPTLISLSPLPRSFLLLFKQKKISTSFDIPQYFICTLSYININAYEVFKPQYLTHYRHSTESKIKTRISRGWYP